MTKVTPFPWEYDAAARAVYGPPHRHAQSAELGVEMVNRPIVAYVRGHSGEIEERANGALIAAAPRQRGALERIAAIASDYGTGQRMSADDVADILETARAALADVESN